MIEGLKTWLCVGLEITVHAIAFVVFLPAIALRWVWLELGMEEDDDDDRPSR